MCSADFQILAYGQRTAFDAARDHLDCGECPEGAADPAWPQVSTEFDDAPVPGGEDEVDLELHPERVHKTARGDYESLVVGQ